MLTLTRIFSSLPAGLQATSKRENTAAQAQPTNERREIGKEGRGVEFVLMVM